MNSMLSKLALVLVMLVLAAIPAGAFAITEVKSPGGITAWLVEDPAIPLVAMSFSFRAGSTSDPDGKEGVAHFLTGMMDEGAADLDSAAFQLRRDELGLRMSFDVGLDYFEGTVQSLSKNRDASFELVEKAITAPRFEADAVERMRQNFLLDISQKNDDPQHIAFAEWMKLALNGDPYSEVSTGTAQTVSKISAEDLKEAHHRIFNRSTLQVSVVGDIDAATLGPLLDRVFGKLPEGAAAEIAPPLPVNGKGEVKIIPRDIPQSIIVFGHEGPKRNDPEFIAAYVMSEILGGGSFSSRLSEEIREKRGLTYGVSAGFSPLRRLGFFLGSLSTRNEKAAEALGVVRQELQRMASEGPAQKELDEAKTYLTGSYALRFTSNSAISNQLLGLQQEGLGIGYVETRNSMIEAVTLEQVKAQARRLLHPDRLLVTIVGKPEGLN